MPRYPANTSTAIPIGPKDPDAVLDYAWDWKANTNGTDTKISDWLAAGEAITGTPTITITGNDSSLTVDSQSNASGQVTVWLSGGTVGETYTVGCRITTDAGRTDERSVSITVAQR